MCTIWISAALLLLCTTATRAEPRRSHQQQQQLRHLQSDIFDSNILLPLPIEIDTPSPTPPPDAILRGTVYMDENKNSQYDPVLLETPLPNVVVKLFTCSNGSRIGITRTNDEGMYTFTIPGSVLPPTSSNNFDPNSGTCHFIQFTVSDAILENAQFSTPMNGETSDIYIGRGQQILNVNAGIYGATPQPTNEWWTYVPTINGTPEPTPFIPVSPPVSNAPISLAPTSAAPIVATLKPSALAPIGLSPTSKPSLAPMKDTAGVPPSSVTWLDEQYVEPNVETPKVGSDSSTIELKSIVRIELENVNSQMDDDASGVFESVCAQFLNDNLVLATPPIYDVTCNVVDQSLVEERKAPAPAPLSSSESEPATITSPAVEKEDWVDLPSTTMEESPVNNASVVTGETLGEAPAQAPASPLKRYLEGSIPRGLRGSASSRVLAGDLTVIVEVTGLVEKSSSIQEPADVPFDDLLVGTFNVQGNQFIEALQEESLSDSSTYETSQYFAQMEAVNAMITYDGLGAQESDSEDTQNESSFWNKGIIAAIAAGGVILIVLLFLIIVKVKKGRATKRKGESKALASGESMEVVDPTKTKTASKQNSFKTSKASKKSSPLSPQQAIEEGVPAIETSPSSSSSPSSPQSLSRRPSQDYVAPASPSGEMEISLDPVAAPTTTKSPTNRVQREVWAPCGKLGIMVANTAGYGPAIHTIRPGSPLEGLAFVSDIIIAVNDVDTKEYTAEQITKIMKETRKEPRKITVLSAHR